MIEAKGLTKRYGDTVAVDHLSFEVRPGQVTGFLGPNGSGKSTTMRMVMGLDRPDGGSVTVNGRRYHDLPWPLREVGGLLESKAVHPGRSAYNHLWSLAQTNAIPAARVDELLELVGLAAVARKRAGKFSLGMTQRLGIAAALLGDPGVLLFDEPINGLDPEGILWVRTLLKRLAAEGRAVFVSSHLMSEMALTADHLVVIGRGRLIADQPVSAFVAQSSRAWVRVRTPQPTPLTTTLVEAGAQVHVEADGALVVHGLTAAAIGDRAAGLGIALHELSPQAASLEEAFMELTHESVEFRLRRGEGPRLMVAVSPARGALPPGRYRFSGALRAEWTKLRSVRSTAWCVLATVVAGLGIGILASASEASRWRNGDVVDMLLFDPTSVSLTGLILGQLAIGVLGVLTMSAEYGSGSIRATLAAIPRRPVVLGAKAVVLGAVALVASEAVSFAAFFVGQAIMSGSAPTATLSGHEVLRAVIGGGLFLTVLGLFALGLATIIRHTAGSITTFVAILLILPLIDSAFPAKIGWPIGRYLPATIGAAMTSTTTRGAHADFLPSFPFWHGFALLCAYALGALVIGGVLMVRRDP